MIMHNTWKVNCKLQPSDGGVLEHESICKALELAIEYDQLNIGELAAIELLCHRLQMIQYCWKERRGFLALPPLAPSMTSRTSSWGWTPHVATFAFVLPLTLGWARSCTRRLRQTRNSARPGRTAGQQAKVRPPPGGIWDHGVALSTRATSCSLKGSPLFLLA